MLAPPILVAAAPAPGTALGFRLTVLEGGELDLAAFRGRPTLAANTASVCGSTPQYAGLQRLHERFGPRGLAVIGVPSNDFDQEVADAGRIRSFCETRDGCSVRGFATAVEPDAPVLVQAVEAALAASA